MQRLCVFLLIAGSAILYSLEEKQAIFQAHSMMLMRDFHAAQLCVQEGLRFFPESQPLRELFVKVLAENGHVVEACHQWQRLGQQSDDVLESMAWGILEKAENSDQLGVYLTSMLGAAQIQDVRAVHLIHRQLRSHNAYARAMAASFTAQYGDEMLLSDLLRLLETEKVWYVRLEVIKALCRFPEEIVAPKFKAIAANSRASSEERATAIQALASVTESVSDAELKALVESPRAGLRHLAAQIILYLDLEEHKEQLVSLLRDTNIEVKCAAAFALGYMSVTDLDIESDLEELRASHNGRMAIVAGWLSLFTNPSCGMKTLYTYVCGSDPVLRRLAAAAIAAGGERSLLLARKVFKQSRDPYVRVTLACALVGREEMTADCCKEIAAFLEQHEGKIMEERAPGFPFAAIAPSEVRHIPDVARYPEMVDQGTRLGLYHTLAVMRYPKALEAIKTFLGRQHLGIPYTAARVLLAEGNRESITLVQELLSDRDEEIRLQAAIVLAMLEPSEKVLSTIEGVYDKVDRNLKLHVIDAFGHFGTKKSLPFLINRLAEPHASLRVAAASSIIRLLNH